MVRPLTSELRDWLLEAQSIGFIGPKPIDTVYQHALGFAESIDIIMKAGAIPSSFIAADLGSGAGVPGLFLASWYPSSEFLLIDSMKKRFEFLRRMIVELRLDDRVEVFGDRSEICARERGSVFDIVTARGFAIPSATAENASGLLKSNGVLLVSEPPGSDLSRWPINGVKKFGFSSTELIDLEFSFCWMVKSGKASGKFPRGVGFPEKLPLF